MPKLRHGELQSRVLSFFEGRRGRVVTLEQIIRHVYQDDEDGGPLNAENNIRVTISRLRKAGHMIGVSTGYIFGQETRAYAGLRRQ